MNKLGYLRLALLICIVLNIIMLANYFFKVSLVYFNSDTASNLLLANEMQEKNVFIVKDWIYNNKDVFIHNYQIIAAIIIKYFGVSYSSHAIASIIFAILILEFIYLGIKKITSSVDLSLIVVAIFSSGISSPFVTQLLYDWGGAYGSLIVMCIIFWACLNSLRLSKLKNINWKNLLISVFIASLIIFISTVSNPSRALIYLITPGVITIIAWGIIYRRYINNISIYTGLITIIIFALAFYLGVSVNETAYSSKSILTEPKLYDLKDINIHLGMIFKSYLYLFGFPSSVATQPHIYFNKFSLFESIGIYSVLLASISVSVFAIQLHMLFKTKSYLLIKPLFIFPFASLFVSLLFHVLLFRYPNEQDFSSIRYIFPALLLMLIFWIIDKKFVIKKFVKKHLFFSIILVSFLNVNGYMNYVYPERYVSERTNETNNFINCLKNNNLTHGYAEFWDSSVITVLSNDEIKIRPIVLESERIKEFPFLKSKNWYKNSDADFYFLALNVAKVADIKDSVLLNKLNNTNNIITCANKIIYILDKNINFFENEKTILKFKSNTLNQSGSATIDILPGTPGFKAFGNYTNVHAGLYDFNLNILVADNPKNTSCGYVDFAINFGKTVLKKISIEEGILNEKLYLEGDVDSLEARIYSSGNCFMSFSNEILLTLVNKK